MANPFGAAQGRTGFVSDVDSARIATFLRGVYWWMFGGLAVTATVALAVASSPAAVRRSRANSRTVSSMV